MKNKTLLFTLCAVMIISLTGCGKTEQKETKTINLKKGNFSIICTSTDTENSSVATKNETTYNFNEDQYAINYKVVTTQKFDDKSMYNEYKKSQEETVKSSTEDVIYDLKSNDKTKTLIFTMAITNIDINNAESEEEKENLKASSILKSAEESNDTKTTCTVNGIDKSKLK